MPTGSWLLDLVFNTKFGFGLYKMLCLPDTTVPEKYPEVSLERSMGGNLEFCDHQDSDNQNQNQNHKGEATFHMNGEHVNPFGSMHGGCHAVLMEMCGEKFIRTLLNNNNNNNNTSLIVVLEAIQIDFISAARGSEVKIVCEELQRRKVVEEESTTTTATTTTESAVQIHLRVRLKRPSDGKTISDGKLRFSAVVRTNQNGNDDDDAAAAARAKL
eukprot:CAMPEP_0202448448 /NCGR_PEP_ID=MMETSP1360-20130828/7261_1 /ASSEMBLY_ACC=CAM_ASM_000848 /TAXON_ID=515479 /ORGANISM="Licmophora paradoxa, Strain CCMP2313" /LENGTH=214 /DNA_ID=CAMNT_0049066023 /DNA_START=392 /DNA_END=1032 /DNA_ORIENTATION=+